MLRWTQNRADIFSWLLQVWRMASEQLKAEKHETTIWGFREHFWNLCQNHLCSVSLWLSLFPAFFFLFNCWIIHLRALIYPPSSALYVQPLCETFSWISNELVAYKVSLPGKAPIYGHVCLFFININPLGESVRMPSFQERSRERPWAGSPTVSVSLVSLWLLGW